LTHIQFLFAGTSPIEFLVKSRGAKARVLGELARPVTFFDMFAEKFSPARNLRIFYELARPAGPPAVGAAENRRWLRAVA
jgi:hypothetical protein